MVMLITLIRKATLVWGSNEFGDIEFEGVSLKERWRYLSCEWEKCLLKEKGNSRGNYEVCH